MTLVKYRDAGMSTYTYFYKDDSNHTISPFFNSEKEAEEWLKQRVEQFENWKASKDIV